MNMRVDLDRQLHFSSEIVIMSLRPNIIVLSTTVNLTELTVPLEGEIKTAFECKEDKYEELAAECQEAGWRGCGGA